LRRKTLIAITLAGTMIAAATQAADFAGSFVAAQARSAIAGTNGHQGSYQP
jgi:hypothetical protein